MAKKESNPPAPVGCVMPPLPSSLGARENRQPPTLYRTGEPPCTGSYACRVPMLEYNNLWEDIFLFYDKENWGWSYPMSDQRYRSEVPYWIGPLQRKMS